MSVNKKTIEEIASYYQTDKQYSDHNYTEIYEKYFEDIRYNNLEVAEIGILKHPARPFEGASLLLWKDYFENSTIHGIDINDHTHMQQDRLKIYIADQGDRSRLDNVFDLNGPMDIIIDDGSHWMHHQQISFAHLFKKLKSGGIYVIEDLFSSYPPPPFPPLAFQMSENDTRTLDMLIEFNKTGKMDSMFMTDEEMSYLENNIKSCNLHDGTMGKIAFIIKK
jgi:demethylmacrocin O-methyltransferase